MKHNRLLVLNLYLPIGLSFYNGVGRALPTINIDTAKTLIIYLMCSLPVFFVAHWSSQFAFERLKNTKVPLQFSLILGAATAVLFAYFYLWGFSIFVWNWMSWLKTGFSYEFTPSMGGFWVYMHSSTSLLFFPTWFFANFVYEYATRDSLYFDHSSNEQQNSAEDEPTKAAIVDQPKTGIVSKIPRHLGSTIVALEAQQHYVRVYTAAGSDLVLYRFGDAVHELESQGLGIQVHRSFLMAPDYVVDTKRVGRSVVLCMTNGLEVPVSQSYRSLVSRLLDTQDDVPVPDGAAVTAN